MGSTGSASAYPDAWKRAAWCIHLHESADWHINNGNGYWGGYQFAPGTYLSYAPRSFPRAGWLASPAQQTLVAWRVWRANGRRWGGGQWPVSSRECGVK